MSAENKFQGVNDAVWGPARDLYAITPSDAVDFVNAGIYLRRLYVGGAGNLAVIAIDDSAPVTFLNVPAGTTLEVRVRAVMATGTTATGIVGMG